MKVEKRDPKQNKTYRSTHRRLDSKKNSILELEGLLARINNRIQELSTFMREVHNTEDVAYIDQMNKLKLHRTQVEYALKGIKERTDEGWIHEQEELNQLFEKAETLLVSPAK